jgi:transmembrane sensor
MPSAGRRWLAPIVSAALTVAAALLVATIVRVPRPATTGGHAYVTVPGQRESVTLSDGTQLSLAPASRLTVSADYGVSRRDVALEGEAYFVVAHDGRRPFAVHVRNAIAQDIGTRFSVRSYPETPTVRVVVADGAVALDGKTLTRDMLGEVDAGGRTTVTTGIDTAAYLAWTRGELVFRRATLRDVAPDLSRWYGVDIRLADPSLDSLMVTTSFKDESLDEALTSLAASLRVSVARHGSVVVFDRLTQGGRT